MSFRACVRFCSVRCVRGGVFWAGDWRLVALSPDSFCCLSCSGFADCSCLGGFPCLCVVAVCVSSAVVFLYYFSSRVMSWVF